ncbi:helix-turn-helix transcriptional regulator [Streptomyces sp. NBC_01537]|uniref:response regulator transcription factor n=1 Tax=Streptomyces sp. NBC_01537 TaxID=2903896 RepID=UPI003865D7FB
MAANLTAPQVALDSGTGKDLSPRERQVLAHIAAGYTHFQTSRRLSISQSSVDTYLQRIRTKLDAPTRADLIRAAIRLGL